MQLKSIIRHKLNMQTVTTQAYHTAPTTSQRQRDQSACVTCK